MTKKKAKAKAKTKAKAKAKAKPRECKACAKLKDRILELETKLVYADKTKVDIAQRVHVLKISLKRMLDFPGNTDELDMNRRVLDHIEQEIEGKR